MTDQPRNLYDLADDLGSALDRQDALMGLPPRKRAPLPRLEPVTEQVRMPDPAILAELAAHAAARRAAACAAARDAVMDTPQRQAVSAFVLPTTPDNPPVNPAYVQPLPGPDFPADAGQFLTPKQIAAEMEGRSHAQ
jgi:hypothetical protein